MDKKSDQTPHHRKYKNSKKAYKNAAHHVIRGLKNQKQK